MTQEDQDAIIGRTIRELRDVREKLATLKNKAQEMGTSFSAVTNHLRNQPEFLRLAGEFTDSRFMKPPRSHYESHPQDHIPTKESLSIDAVLAIRDEIRASLLEQDRLTKSLEEMGYKQ